MSSLSSKSVVRTSRYTGSIPRLNLTKTFIVLLHNYTTLLKSFDALMADNIHTLIKSIRGSIINSIKADKDRFIKWMNNYLKNSLS